MILSMRCSDLSLCHFRTICWNWQGKLYDLCKAAAAAFFLCYFVSSDRAPLFVVRLFVKINSIAFQELQSNLRFVQQYWFSYLSKGLEVKIVCTLRVCQFLPPAAEYCELDYNEKYWGHLFPVRQNLRHLFWANMYLSMIKYLLTINDPTFCVFVLNKTPKYMYTIYIKNIYSIYWSFIPGTEF